MDAYYASQMSSTFQGPARQFGSGAGIGAFALRMGRTAIPFLKKYVGPFLKQVGQNVLEATNPEFVNLVKGKKKLKTAVKDSAKKAISKTIEANAKAGGAAAGGARAVGNTAAGGRKRKPPSAISNKKLAKRSRVDILANVKFNK